MFCHPLYTVVSIQYFSAGPHCHQSLFSDGISSVSSGSLILMIESYREIIEEEDTDICGQGIGKVIPWNNNWPVFVMF
jgi:hypothetical protein